MNSTQIAIPIEVSPHEVAREKTFHGSLELCAKAAGFDVDKQLTDAMGMDKSQLSRWFSGLAAPTWPKLNQLMDVCGNDAPLLWMIHQRGYDINSLRKRETEVEKKLREANEQIEHLQQTILSLGQHAHRERLAA